MARPRLSDDEREQRRLAKNQRQRARRAEIRGEKEDARAKLARLGVHKTAAPINEKTLRIHFEPELREGPIKANAKVGESLYQQATGTGGANRSTAAGIFWAKARMGWRETQHVEVDVKSGVLIAPGGSTPEQWVAAVHEQNEGKTEPGKKDGEA